MSGSHGGIAPQTFIFKDDGLVPNSPLPVLRYRLAIDLAGAEPEQTIENLFGANGWGGFWRNGIYDYLHYHATVHEALGIARGHAHVRLGGDHGDEVELNAGDVVILPAGTGHQCLSASEDFSDSVPAGSVISQEPDSGEVHRGDTVQLVVSKGPQLVAVPDVMHKPLGDARAELLAAGLQPQVHRIFGAGLGLVVQVEPGAGTMVPRGSPVQLTVV